MELGDLDRLLSDLGQLIGLPQLKADEEGLCQLLFGRAWLVTLVAHEPAGRIFLHCPFGTPDTAEQVDATALRMLLQASFLGHGAGGGTLALGPDGRLCLQRELLMVRLDGRQVLEEIERLVAAAQAWALRLAEAPAPVTAPAKLRPRPSLASRMA
ncbi:type III secretion system chaperone [Ramlibacter rhizophilus]|nr:type III secretion system chaperone [Ramlibacter rhizophilus]